MKLILLLFFSGLVQAQNLTVSGPFSGLNDTDSTITLDPGESQDTLNVEVSKDGLALQKRQGYILTNTLDITTSPVYGAINFSDSNGNVYKVFAHDRFLSSSKNEAAFTNIVTTGTVGAEWQFCEASGKIYGFNDSNDIPLSFDGTTVTYYSTMPYASLCAMTVDRMLLAGATTFPNRLYFSESGVLTNFTAGTEPEDPGFEDIGLTGEKITALFATESEWLVFKPHSMISYQGTNQYDLVPIVVSDRVGVGDPDAIIQHEGIVYFKASDGQIWGYASGQLTNLSGKIKNFTDLIVKSADNTNFTYFDTEASWETYIETDWLASGVQPTAIANTDTLNADFNAGTVGAPLEVGDDAVKLKSKIYFANIDFETSLKTNWTENGGSFIVLSVTQAGVGFTTDFGTYSIRQAGGNAGIGCSYWISPQIDLTGSNKIYGETDSSGVNPNYYSIDMSTHLAQNYYLHFKRGSESTLNSTAFTKGNGIIKIGLQRAMDYCYYDVATQAASSGTFTSQIHTTTTTIQHYGYANWGGSEQTPFEYSIHYSSSATGTFDSYTTLSPIGTGTLLSTATAIQYRVVLKNPNQGVDSTLTSMQLVWKTTGSVESPEVYLGNYNTWGQFIADETKQTGSANHWSYQMKTSTYSGGTASASYSTVTSGSVITISTGAYARVKATNTLTAASETVRLNSVYFTDSYSTQRQAAAFEYLGDIYFTVPYNNATTNNRVMKLDLDSSGWQIFNISMNSPVSVGYDIYFGSVTGGHVYKYPFGNSDNGTAINSYWKSKNFIGANPYVENQFQRISLIAGSNSGSNLDITYTMDTTTSTTYTIDLASSTAGFIRNNRALPMGERGTFFNLKIGNNAVNQPWSFYGASIDYIAEPWRVQPED